MKRSRYGVKPLSYIRSLNDPEVEVILLKVVLEYMLVAKYPSKRGTDAKEVELRDLVEQASSHFEDMDALNKALVLRNDLVHADFSRYPPTADQVNRARATLWAAVESLRPKIPKAAAATLKANTTYRTKAARDDTRWRKSIDAARGLLGGVLIGMRRPLLARIVALPGTLRTTGATAPKKIAYIHTVVEGGLRHGTAKSSKVEPWKTRGAFPDSWQAASLPAGRKSLREINGRGYDDDVRLLLLTALLEYALVSLDPDMIGEHDRRANLGYRVNAVKWGKKHQRFVGDLRFAIRIRNQLEHPAREAVNARDLSTAILTCRVALERLLPRLNGAMRTSVEGAKPKAKSGPAWPDLRTIHLDGLKEIPAHCEAWKSLRTAREHGGPVDRLHLWLDRIDGSANLFELVDREVVPSIRRYVGGHDGIAKRIRKRRAGK